MLSLIIALLIGLGVAFFALQNTIRVPVYLWQYALPALPLYTVVIASFITGILIAWVLSLFGSVSSLLTLRGKDHALQSAHTRIRELEAQVRALKEQRIADEGQFRHDNDVTADEEHHHHSFFTNFFHRAV